MEKRGIDLHNKIQARKQELIQQHSSQQAASSQHNQSVHESQVMQQADQQQVIDSMGPGQNNQHQQDPMQNVQSLEQIA